MDQRAFHLHEMTRHFEAGRFASARWHCRLWTRLVAAQKQVFNDGREASRLADTHPACQPSPIHDESRGE